MADKVRTGIIGSNACCQELKLEAQFTTLNLALKNAIATAFIKINLDAVEVNQDLARLRAPRQCDCMMKKECEYTRHWFTGSYMGQC